MRTVMEAMATVPYAGPVATMVEPMEGIDEDAILVLTGQAPQALLACWGNRLVYDAAPWLTSVAHRASCWQDIEFLLAECSIDGRHHLETEDDFSRLPPHRPIYLYGVGAGGRRIRRVIDAVSGLTLIGFIDTSTPGECEGLPVFDLPSFLQQAVANPIIIIASQHWHEIETTLLAHGIQDALNAYPFLSRELWIDHWNRQHAGRSNV
ncbi:hypothetical protein [Azospirillum agricola]|uniref:hypothetical protein n=1 Tax=Azospirillum agricola TaxID=1720247 RepID=UPI000A0F1057|nr:hypothetical protein [Azospirillum agricola]SMH41519.1 hypothetical protein SAMN02982994_1735 [Azospirillum lipoferum]